MEKPKEKVVRYVREHTTTDENGKTVKYERDVVYKVNSGDLFVKHFFNDLERLHSVPYVSRKVLDHLLMNMGYDGLIDVNKRIRGNICEKIGVKDQAFRNALHKLVKANVLKNLGGGGYLVNPEAYGKGTKKNIQERRAEYLKTDPTSH